MAELQFQLASSRTKLSRVIEFEFAKANRGLLLITHAHQGCRNC